MRSWRHTVIRLGTVIRHIGSDLRQARNCRDAAEEIIDGRHIEPPEPVEVIEQTVDVLNVRTALARLSPGHREIIAEMYLRGHSVDETAETLGLPDATVASRSYYALRVLRRTVVAPPAARLGQLSQGLRN